MLLPRTPTADVVSAALQLLLRLLQASGPPPMVLSPSLLARGSSQPEDAASNC